MKKEEQVAKIMNDALNESMEQHPELNALEIMQKAVFGMYDKMATLFNWTEKEKQDALDQYFDSLNSLDWF